MSLKKENFSLVSIIDLMFSFTGILLFLIWGFSSFHKEKGYREAKNAFKDYYSFIIKKAEVSNIKARKDFIFLLKPMIFILDGKENLKFISRKGEVDTIPWEKLQGKLDLCIKENKKLMKRKHLCGAVFLVPPKGFPYVKKLERSVWEFMKKKGNFLPMSYVPFEENVYREVLPLWKK